MSDLRAARGALRPRQGPGARYDAASAPHRELARARSGTAYFARLLDALPDLALEAPIARRGWTRRSAVACLGYHARKLSAALAFVRSGGDGPLPFALEVDDGDIDLAATLPAEALRHLFGHAAVHLDVEWRDLSDTDWQASVEDAAGVRITLRDTPAIRASALWRGALDFDAGGRLADVPSDFCPAGGDASREREGCTFAVW